MNRPGPVSKHTYWTLEDYVVDLFQRGAFESEEFKRLMRLYGREKLEEIWRRYRKMSQENPVINNDC